MPHANRPKEVLGVSVGGLLSLPDGSMKTLQPVEDAEWVEGWLRRSVSPCHLHPFSVPLLPLAEGITIPTGMTVAVIGLEESGQLVALLLDLRRERPISQVLGDSLAVLQWAERLDERQLEAFARTFYRDRHISLRDLYERVYATQSPPTLGSPAKVHVLSWRSLTEVTETQQFLHRYQLPIWFFRFWVFKSPEGEVVVLTERAIAPSPALTDQHPLTIHRFGGGDRFLQSLQGS